MGITALSAIEIAKDLGYEVISKTIKREELFIADELFFTGTAAEITPIREVDGYQIGLASKHVITKKIQNKFFEIVEGKDKNYHKWLTFI
jgi:branched-chain amino acid aminotransferase